MLCLYFFFVSNICKLKVLIKFFILHSVQFLIRIIEVCGKCHSVTTQKSKRFSITFEKIIIKSQLHYLFQKLNFDLLNQ